MHLRYKFPCVIWNPGIASTHTCRLTSIGIPRIKIRRSDDRLIFMMGIGIPTKDGLYFATGPWSPHPDSKVHGANMGPTWVLSAPDGPHVGPINLAIGAVLDHDAPVDVFDDEDTVNMAQDRGHMSLTVHSHIAAITPYVHHPCTWIHDGEMPLQPYTHCQVVSKARDEGVGIVPNFASQHRFSLLWGEIPHKFIRL